MTSIRNKYSTGSGTSISATYDEATVLDSTNGHIAFVRSYSGSGVDLTPNTPAGWTLLDSAYYGSGTFRVGLWAFRKRGDGATNSITITWPISQQALNLQLIAYDGISEDVFTESPVSAYSTGNVTTLATGTVSTSSSNNTVVGALATSGTFGGTGATWDSLTLRAGASQFSSFSWAELDIVTPGDTTESPQWTTATLAATLMVGIRNGTASPPPAGSRSNSTTVKEDFSAWANAASLSASVLAGPTGFDITDITINSLIGEFIDPTGRSETITVEWTISGPGGDTVETYDYLPQGGYIGIGYYDGSVWQY